MEQYEDGIVNLYYFSHPKILFVLKETNNYDKSLTTFLRKLFTVKQVHKKGSKFQMWHTIAKWACGIHTNFRDFSEINKAHIYKPYLQKVAVINLKKIPGGKQTVKTQLKAHAITNKSLIIKQISDIKPAIIIACGTYDLLLKLLEINSTDEKTKYMEAVIIKMRHPSRANQRKTYKELKEYYDMPLHIELDS